MLLSKIFSQPELTFQSFNVTPTRPPLAGPVENSQSFFAPTQPTDRPQFISSLLTDLSDDRPTSTDQPHTDQVSKQAPSTSAVKVAQQP